MAAKKTKDQLACNKPVKSWRPGKKYAVKACANGQQELLHFGYKGMQDYLQHGDEKRRKNFKSRMGCHSRPPSKLTPRYWACNYNW